MEEWKEYRLGSICGYITNRTSNIDNYISTENMLPNKGGICTPSNIPNGSAIEYKVGDILISNIRPYFQKIWYANCDGACSADVLCIRSKSTTDSRYLYYLLSQQAFFDYVMSGAKGCKMPRGDKKQIMQWEVSLPALEEQKKIANILSAIDDKIENNRRINDNLEQQAQALFKSWFVDFEPFKDGNFVDSEVGMIPEEWKVGTLEELIEIKYGKDHKKLNDGDVPVYGSGGIMRYVDKSLFIGESVLIPRKGTLNNVMYVNRDFWTVDTMFFSKMKMSNIAIFVYLFLSKKDLASMNSGSAVPSMTVDILNKISLVIPVEKTFEDFNNIVSSLFFQMSNNSKEITHLTTLRDTLLPKLMSGEMSVDDVLVD